MAIDQGLPFRYQFPVRASGAQQGDWTGDGEGGDFDQEEGFVGPKPRFELSSGWLSLFPTEGWTRSLPARSFPDSRRRVREMDEDARVADAKSFGDQYREASEEAYKEAAARSVPDDYASLARVKLRPFKHYEDSLRRKTPP